MKFRLLLLLQVMFLFHQSNLQGSERIVFPQAVVGSIQQQSFEVELRLGNRNPNDTWTGQVRLLRQQDLVEMSNVKLEDSEGQETTLSSGSFQVSIPPGGSSAYTMRSSGLQVGVLVIDSTASSLSDLVPSFFYRLTDSKQGKAIDLIAIQPAGEPGIYFSTMLSRSQSFNVGV